MHNFIPEFYKHLFTTPWNSGLPGATQSQGDYPRGVKSFEVVDASGFVGRKYLAIAASGLMGDDWADHSSKTRSQIDSNFTTIRANGITIQEYHEIDSVVGNVITIKSPTMTPLNENYSIAPGRLQENFGFEDLHFDTAFNKDFEHNVDHGWNFIKLFGVSHSWVRRCRFSNTISPIALQSCSTVTILSVIMDERYGHNSIGGLNGTTNCFFGLFEDNTNKGAGHGASATSKSVGLVFWANGGDKMTGPDCHGDQPRYTLSDIYQNSSYVNVYQCFLGICS